MRREQTPEGRRLSMVGRTRGETDDTGAFRIWALPPGEYLVSAQPSRFASRNDAPQVPGDGFAPTFYPGTANSADAQRVVVSSGRDTPGVTFALLPAKLAAVRGRVLFPGGVSPARVNVMVSRVEPERSGSSFNGVGVEADGTFTAGRLSPGTYRLTATLREPNGALNASRLRATAEVRVDGADVDGVVLALRSGATLTGRIVSDDGTPMPGAVTVSLTPRQRDVFLPGPSPSGRVEADGTFRLDGVFGRMLIGAFVSAPAANASGDSAPPANTGTEHAAPGRVLMPPSVPTPRAPWGVKAVFVNGRDVTDEPLDFDRGDVEAEIVLTTRLALVTGSVTLPRAPTDPRPTVLVFAADPEAWVPPARRVRQAAVGDDGRFSIRGLPPGDRYLAVAIEGTPTPTSWSPDLLTALRDSATSLRIDEGGVHEIALRVVPRLRLEP